MSSNAELRERLLCSVGEFSWAWNHLFFIETTLGNFVWSDPDYPGGDNSVRQFFGTLVDFNRWAAVPYVRDKGKHIISRYMGIEFTINDPIYPATSTRKNTYDAHKDLLAGE